MKMKISAVLASIFVSLSAYAEPVMIAASEDGAEKWFAYADTFHTYTDGYSMLVGKRTFLANGAQSGNEVRFYLGVMDKTCDAGYGSLLQREDQSNSWFPTAQVQIGTAVSVGDKIAKEICVYGKQQRTSDKPTKKSSTSKVKTV